MGGDETMRVTLADTGPAPVLFVSFYNSAIFCLDCSLVSAVNVKISEASGAGSQVLQLALFETHAVLGIEFGALCF